MSDMLPLDPSANPALAGAPRPLAGNAPADEGMSTTAPAKQPGKQDRKDLPPALPFAHFLVPDDDALCLAPVPKPAPEATDDAEPSTDATSGGPTPTPPTNRPSPPAAPLRELRAADGRAAAHPQKPAEDSAEPVRFGSFQLREARRAEVAEGTEPTGSKPRQPRVGATTLAPRPERQPDEEPRPSHFGQRLRLVLDSRAARPATASGGSGKQSGDREPSERHPATISPGPGPLAAWQSRATASLPSPERPVATEPTNALPRELLPTLREQLPVGTSEDFAGLRLAFESEAHGSVGLDVRCTNGQLLITVRLDHALSPETADSFRREITTACQQRGYADVDVEVRGENSRQGNQRHGHADDDNVRLSGKDFPEEEGLASPTAPDAAAATSIH